MNVHKCMKASFVVPRLSKQWQKWAMLAHTMIVVLTLVDDAVKMIWNLSNFVILDLLVCDLTAQCDIVDAGMIYGELIQNSIA